MSIEQELIEMSAPKLIIEAGRELDKALIPPSYLVQYVLRWVAKHRGNDRYGH